MNLRAFLILGFAVIALGIVAFNALFTIHQTQQALVLQSGEYRRTISDPGLHFKLPFIQKVVHYEKRVLNVDPRVERVILAEHKPFLVDAYARYRIADPLLFYQRMRDERLAAQRLDTIIIAILREILGDVTMATVMSDERANLMRNIQERVQAKVQNFGIDVIDVRIRRAQLPPRTRKAVYARMRSSACPDLFPQR